MDGDVNKICMIMSAFRRIYHIIFCVIMSLGMMLIPFLDGFITGVEYDKVYLVLIWIIMTISSASTYLFSYNNALFYADQKQYVIVSATAAINLLIILINCCCTVWFSSPTVYVSIQLLGNIINCAVIMRLRRKYYPWLVKAKTEKSLYRGIFDSTKDVFVGRMANYVFNSTDNIVISSFISTALVGVVGNYVTVIVAIKSVVAAIIGPIQNLSGNFLVTNTGEKREHYLKLYTFCNYLVMHVLMIPTAMLLGEFVRVFYGKQFELNGRVLTLLVVDMYLALAQGSVGQLLDADGHFGEQKKFYIISSIANIAISVLGAIFIGIEGVIIGTITGNLICWIMRSYYAYKLVIGNAKGLREYFIDNVIYAVLFVFSFYMCNYFSVYVFKWDDNPITFCIKGFIFVLIILLFDFVIWGSTNRGKYVASIIRAFFN